MLVNIPEMAYVVSYLKSQYIQDEKNKALMFRGISYTNIARQTAWPEDLS